MIQMPLDMDKLKLALRDKAQSVKLFFETDWNIVRARRYGRRAWADIRNGARRPGRSLVKGFPLVYWVRSYNPRWLLGDVLSGVTVGIVLALQAAGLASSSAGGAIYTQQTLMASWLPGLLYALTGSSKNISIGPTSAGTFLSLQIIGPFAAAARIPPFVVLPALTFCVSVWFLLFGLLRLGFLFDLIPLPISLAVVTAIALNLVTLQLPTLLGLNGITTVVPAILPAVFANFTNISPRTLAISISAIVLLLALRLAAQKWENNKTASGKAARVGYRLGTLLVVLVFTIVSFLFLQNLPIAQQVVPPLPPTTLPQQSIDFTTRAGASPVIIPAGRDEPRVATAKEEFPSEDTSQSAPQPRSEPEALPNGQPSSFAAAAATPPLPKLPFWAVFPKFTTKIVPPLPPVASLVRRLFLPSLLVFVVLNVEHHVVAKTFGHYHKYTVSQDSEMFAAGLSNLAGSFFGAVPVGGGDMARSSLLAVTGAKSPLNQAFTSVTVLFAMMPLSGALRFLPQAALSAAIVAAVLDQQPPQKLFAVYFRLSFAEFAAFVTALGIGVAVPVTGPAIATAAGVGLMVLYTLLRGMFARPAAISATDLDSLYREREVVPWRLGDEIPPGTRLFRLETDMLWTNADRVRRHIVDTCMVHNSGAAADGLGRPERTWKFSLREHVADLRRRHGVDAADDDDPQSLSAQRRPRLRVVVLDMTSTLFLDCSAVMSLDMMKRQLRQWAGEGVEFRFVGLNARLLKRFERAGWQIVDPCEHRLAADGDGGYTTRDLMFGHVPFAVHFMNPKLTLEGIWEEVAVVMGSDIDKIEKAYI